MADAKSPFTITGIPTLASHLNKMYGIEVVAMTELDVGVLRIDRHEGPSWVARIFPTRSTDDVRCDAVVLDRLEEGGFPAERNAAPEPVSIHDDQTVLVTEFVSGKQPKPGARTFAYLGGLLGALHAREGLQMPAGGGWHHLVSRGTPSDEVRAIQMLLDGHAPSVAPSERTAFNALCAAVEKIDTCDDLAHCFVHPDMVPTNAVELDDGSFAIVDWANAGRGPRLWSLGMALFAAGARDIRMVEKLVSRYVRWTAPHPDELARLAGAIRARPLTIHAWEIVYGREPLSETLPTLRFLDRVSEDIAEAARAAFALPR